MLIKPHFILRAPDAAGTAAGQLGAGGTAGSPLPPLHALAAKLSDGPAPGEIVSEQAQSSPGTSDPAQAAATGAAGDAGQPTSPPGETPPGELETPPGEAPNPPADAETANAEIAQALNALSPTERAAALDLFKKERGRLPTLAKLTALKYTNEKTIEQLQQENEQLRNAETPDATPQTPDSLPPTVAKLNSVAKVEARQAQLESLVDGLQDFLDANPGDPKTVYDAQTQEVVNVEADGKRYLTRAQIIAERASARAELKALPKRAAQIAQIESLRTTHAQVHTNLLAKFPHLGDPENAETKLYHAALQMPAIASHPGGPLIALKLAKGHTLVEAELAKANGNGNGKAPVTQPFTPARTPLKPAAPPARTPAPLPKPAVTDEQFKTAVDGLGRQGSRTSLAAVLAASNR